jgi:hypothetical protein
VPFSFLAKRELEGNMETHSLLPRSTTGSPIDIPEGSSSTCAFSAKGVFCADPDDKKLNCDMNTLYLDDDSEDAEDSAIMRRGVLEKRSEKKLWYCTAKSAPHYSGFPSTGVKINFSKFPTSTELVKDYLPNAATYDAQAPGDCLNLKLVKLKTTPTTPITKNPKDRQYHSEHILEAQTVQRFFNHVGMLYGTLKEASGVNKNARTYPNPSGKKPDSLSWCMWMDQWWRTKLWDQKNANDHLGSQFLVTMTFMRNSFSTKIY